MVRLLRMDWYNEIKFFSSTDFASIVDYLNKEIEQGKTILPDSSSILNAYALTPLSSVKVVILGQDPYPTPGHAHGLAFSVQPHVKPLPKSLQNIFKELVNDIGCTYPSNGSLVPWTEQGVLLLNTSLTVVAGKPNSHSNIGWSKLVNETIQLISKKKENVVFILWGANAQAKSALIDSRKHHIIKSPHPSPLSAHRGFFGSKPFSKTNAYLCEASLKEIDWELR